jgi:microcystin-dependent protein
MASTSYKDFTSGVRGIVNRTDAAGVAVVDYTAEEDRLANLLTEGYVTPDGAFRVQASTGMDVTVGSGSAKTDLYAVEGDQAGQGVYLVRLDDVQITVTVPAADASQTRVDEVWLVVADNAYDAGGVSLPRIGYRTGTPGGGNPGPDAAWDAAALLARITVPAGAASITAGNISDLRGEAQIRNGVPAGTIQMYAGASAPSGWLLCQGQAVSRTTYARLFGVVGTTFGAGDGSATFNLPDLRDRFPVGASTGTALAAAGGATSHDHLAASTSAGGHQHPSADHSHTGAVPEAWLRTDGASQTVELADRNHTHGTGTGGAHQHGTTGAHTHPVDVDPTDGRPPYLGLTMIIKA